MELAQTPNELGMRNRNQALRVERTLTQERNCDGNFESRSTDARGVWHQGHERAILIAGRDAKHQGWPHLGCKTKVDEPDFTPPWGSQA
jgi:hypothetical protein